MAAGDVVMDTVSVANGAYMTIQPVAGVEWVIHNIMYVGNCELSQYDGTNEVTFDTVTGAGAWVGQFFHVTNSDYLRVKNTSGATAVFGYSGMETK